MNRLPFLDGLRLAAFALLIPYHVGMYYVSWDWHVKSATLVPALEPFMLLTAPWRMGLLFVIAGAACQGLWTRRGRWGCVRDRSSRLLWPLLLGLAVIVTPQAYFEVLTKVPAQLPGDGGYLDFWAAYLRGGHYCRGSDCMVVPTWNHLWFLPYLWAYSLMGAALAGRVKWPVTALPAWAWLLLPAVPLALARTLVFPHFPVTHDLVHDLYSHLQYGWLFALGWASRTPLAAGLWPAALRWRWAALGAALASWALLLAYFKAYDGGPPPAAALLAQRVLWAALSWWAILAACGWGQRAFSRNTPALKAGSAAVFCAYVLHQTVIVLLTRALLPLALPWGIEAPLLMALTVAICALAYLGLRRVPGLRLLFGISVASSAGAGPVPPPCSSTSSNSPDRGSPPAWPRRDPHP
jgi:glucans biosynthesis protein C